MFNSIIDELKEVNYLKRNNRFQESYNVKYFKEIKWLKNLQKAEAYLEPKQASTMDLYYEIYLTAYYFRNKSSVIEVRLGQGLWKYWNFQNEAKLEQIIAIVTTRIVSCCYYCSANDGTLINNFYWERYTSASTHISATVLSSSSTN